MLKLLPVMIILSISLVGINSKQMVGIPSELSETRDVILKSWFARESSDPVILVEGTILSALCLVFISFMIQLGLWILNPIWYVSVSLSLTQQSESLSDQLFSIYTDEKQLRFTRMVRA